MVFLWEVSANKDFECSPRFISIMFYCLIVEQFGTLKRQPRGKLFTGSGEELQTQFLQQVQFPLLRYTCWMLLLNVLKPDTVALLIFRGGIYILRNRRQETYTYKDGIPSISDGNMSIVGGSLVGINSRENVEHQRASTSAVRLHRNSTVASRFRAGPCDFHASESLRLHLAVVFPFLLSFRKLGTQTRRSRLSLFHPLLDIVHRQVTRVIVCSASRATHLLA